MNVIIYVTHPIRRGDKLLEAGTITEVSQKEAERYVEAEWAFVMEEKPKEKSKHGDRED